MLKGPVRIVDQAELAVERERALDIDDDDVGEIQRQGFELHVGERDASLVRRGAAVARPSGVTTGTCRLCSRIGACVTRRRRSSALRTAAT
jgi:hypothetical protein